MTPLTLGRCARADVAAAEAFDLRFNVPLMLGSTLNPINSSIVATALVPIAAALGVPLGRVTLLVTVLYVASAIAQPAMVGSARSSVLGGPSWPEWLSSPRPAPSARSRLTLPR